MKYLKLYENREDIQNIAKDIAELLIDLEDVGIIIEDIGDNHIHINSGKKCLFILPIIQRLEDALTQFEDYEIDSISAHFTKTKSSGWATEGKFKFSNRHYTPSQYEMLLKDYKYDVVEYIKNIKKEDIFSKKCYKDIYVVFTKKEIKKNVFKTIKSFFKSK